MRVALPVPLDRAFDYRWGWTDRPILPGTRVRVPFGARRLIGIVLGPVEPVSDGVDPARATGAASDSVGSRPPRGSGGTPGAQPPADVSTIAARRLRDVLEVLDERPVLDERLLDRLAWAAGYYHHPIGEVLAAALPVALRKGAATEPGQHERFTLVPSREEALGSLGRAPLQRALVERLAGSDGVDALELRQLGVRWRASLAPLLERGMVRRTFTDRVPRNEARDAGPELAGEQAAARDAVLASLDAYAPFLLNGVTGSGKTEVYLQVIREVLARGRQVLVLVPEIALTPQLMARFAARLSGCLVSLHSGLNETERLQGWLLAARGIADVVIGTRSAVLTPLPRLGLVIVDEEHDGSLKQQEGFRYHARDMALMRARDAGVPAVLGSATPSFESLHNVATGRYRELALRERAGGASPPSVALVDIRRRPLTEGLSEPLVNAIANHLDEGGQAMVFINRRGFAPTLLCNDCGSAADCQRCDAHMTVHARSGRLRCHHCGAERAVPSRCESCGSVRLDRVGQGTERIADALLDAFPDVELARIDRDSTRRKGSLEHALERATSGRARLLVGTQMLAKGHHFPALTLVGILDVDRSLFGTDFRALEQMAQLVVQVAGRAGRERRAGSVLIQTRNPDNPMLRTLAREGYAAFAEAALLERRLADWPPFSHVALVRCDAPAPERALDALQAIADFVHHDLERRERAGDLMLLGPAPAPIERVAGRFRARLLLQSGSRALLHETLARLVSIIDELPHVRRVRWAIDVDPVDLG